MKKFAICLCALALTFQVAMAQSKGDMSIGGLIGVETQTTFHDSNDETQTTFKLAPQFSYFLINNLRLTGTLAYELTSYRDDWDVNTVYVGPSLAYYVRLCNGLYYTPEFNIGFAYQTFNDMDFYGFSTGLKFFALEFKPIEHFGMSMSLLSLDYAYFNYSEDHYTTDYSKLGFRLALNPTVAFKYYF